MTRIFEGLPKPATLMVLALAASACGDSTSPQTADAALRFDVAVAAGDATLEDIALWSQPFNFGAAPSGAAEGAGSRGWSADVVGIRTVYFYDADGGEQAEYDPETTASIRILQEATREVTRDTWSGTIHRERDMVVSGLVGAETERTWNGSGSEEVHREGYREGGTQRTYDASGSFTYDDVVMPVTDTEPRYPLSGTITRSLTVTVSGLRERTWHIDIVITFDGTSTATAIVNGEEMEIDLSTLPGHLPVRRPRG